MRRRVALIAAVASNGIIGAANRLPWHLPEDLAHFRALTLGHCVVMGRQTWASIGRPLPNRQNIVVTRQAGLRIEGAAVAHSLEQALSMSERADPVFVIGGEALYRAEIDRAFAGDARFPAFERALWREVARDVRASANSADFAYHFATYERAPV